MKPDTEQKGIVIEATPEPQHEAEPEEHPSSSWSGRIALFLSLLIISTIGAALFLTYPIWQQMQKDMDVLQQQIADTGKVQSKLQSELSKAIELTRQHQEIMGRQQEITQQQLQFMGTQEKAFDQQNQRIADAEHSMAKKELALGTTIAEVRKLAAKPDNLWMAVEADYLLQLANQRLYLAYDPKTAMLALQRADQRLAATGEARWNEIRAQIARDSASLSNFSLPAIEPLSQQLDLLIGNIPALRLANRPPEAAREKQAAAPTETTEPSWDNLLNSIWEGAKNTVRIRRNDQPVQALIGTGQSALLYQNLQLMLESSRLGLVQRNTPLFRDSLQRATHWLQTRFDPHDPGVQSTLKALDELAKVELLPEMPDISRSLEYLRTTLQAEQVLRAEGALKP